MSPIRIQGIRGLWHKGPYIKRASGPLVTVSRHQPASIMRGDYYVVPPNGARIHMYYTIAYTGAPLIAKVGTIRVGIYNLS